LLSKNIHRLIIAKYQFNNAAADGDDYDDDDDEEV